MTTQQEHNAAQSDQAATTPPDADEEFDAAFAEATGLGGEPAEKPATAAQTDEGNDSAAEPPAPAPAAAAEGQPEAQPPAGATTDDFWANAPAEYRERFEQQQRDWDHRYRSVHGRAVSLERHLNELRAQQGQQRNDSEGTQGQGQQGAGAIPAEQIQQLREDYPEVAGPLLSLIEDLNGRLAQVQPVVSNLTQAQQVQAYAQQEQVLASVHPDFREVVGSQQYWDWLYQQPAAVQQMHERNQDNLVDGQEAAFLIGSFKQAMGRQAPAPAAEPKPDAQQRRQRQIAGGRDASRSSPVTVTGVSKDDFDTGLEEAFAMQAGRR